MIKGAITGKSLTTMANPAVRRRVVALGLLRNNAESVSGDLLGSTTASVIHSLSNWMTEVAWMLLFHL